jgi:hypothetical protein
MQGIFCLAEELSTYQEFLYTMELLGMGEIAWRLSFG